LIYSVPINRFGWKTIQMDLIRRDNAISAVKFAIRVIVSEIKNK